MTKHVVVTVFDSAARTFGPPMLVSHPGLSIRQFTNEVNRADEKNPLFTNSEDFELYQVALFDDETCRFDPFMKDGVPTPELLITGKNVKRTVN